MRNTDHFDRRGIRFFPHIIPIGFPLIFPLGFGLALALFRLMLPIAIILSIVVLAVFIMESVSRGSTRAGWNAMLNTGNQLRQRFTSQQQPPYYQPSQPYGQGHQPSPQAGQEPPYYQPSQPYGQGYQSGQPYYPPEEQIR